MRTATLACALLAAGVSAEVYFEDNFTTDPFEGGRWVVSDWKDSQSTGKWGWRAGEWSVDAEKEKGLYTADDMKFYAASAKLDKSFRCEPTEERRSPFCVWCVMFVLYFLNS